MMQKIKTIFLSLSLGITLGATLGEKIRLALFLLKSRLVRDQEESRVFAIKVLDRVMRVHIRNNFSDLFILNEAFRSPEYVRGLPAKDPQVIFDVGANIGLITLFLKSKYPTAKIVCFEPDPDTFLQLTKNTEQFSDVACVQAAIGSGHEVRTFYKNPHFHMRNSLLPQDGGEKFDVQVITLSEALVQAGVDHVDLLKFDIEGAETELFLPFKEFEKIRSVMGELHPYFLSSEEYKKLVEALEREYNSLPTELNGKVFFYGTKQ